MEGSMRGNSRCVEREQKRQGQVVVAVTLRKAYYKDLIFFLSEM